ncbi:hypothetical protein F4777DRAFT_533871 [Nemania sp. FL0916]|nr:hypothetical protein F4777DRAFT_533871 [Nemania sp. FL0916]
MILDPSSMAGATELVESSSAQVAITLENSDGIPTKTVTLLPITTMLTQSTTRGSFQNMTLGAFQNTTFTTPTPSSTTTATPTSSAGDPGPIVQKFVISEGQYFLATFATTLISTLLSFPMRIIDLHMQRLEPYHLLTRPSGSIAAHSLCKEIGSVQGILSDLINGIFRSQWRITLLTALLGLTSAITTIFSSEVFVIVLHGSCRHGGGSAANCAYTLGVSTLGARITEALLLFMGAQTLLLLYVLRGWRSGVHKDPWSIAEIRDMVASSRSLRNVLAALPADGDRDIPKEAVDRAFAPFVFRLRYTEQDGGPDGEVVATRRHDWQYVEGSWRRWLRVQRWKASSVLSCFRRKTGKNASSQPFLRLRVVSRCLVIAFMSGVLALIGYYNNPHTYAPFEKFLDSESFGIRTLFTAIGVVITFAWGGLFTGVSMLSPYVMMAKSQPTHQALVTPPPTSSLTGLWAAARQRNLVLGITAFTGALSEFLPLLLANVPFMVTQTWLVHLVSTWFSVAIIGFMVLVLVGSFFIKWPSFPVDPRTVAGASFCAWSSPSFCIINPISPLE